MSKLLYIFIKPFYKKHKIRRVIDGIVYEVEYHRSPFWTYEKPSIILFFKNKLCTWHGQVWEVFPNGGRCGFATSFVRNKMFPRKRFSKFLDVESRHIHKICHSKDNVTKGGRVKWTSVLRLKRTKLAR